MESSNNLEGYSKILAMNRLLDGADRARGFEGSGW